VNTKLDQERIRQALLGNNEDRKRIALVGLHWVATLIAKNADYGSSVWRPPALRPDMDPGDAILVRMSDKISRIASLASPAAQDAAQVDESLEDTIQDLGAYALLWLARPKAEPESEDEGPEFA